MRRNRTEENPRVVYRDINGAELAPGDQIAITYPDGKEETHELKSQHGEPPVIRKGDSFLPLPYLLSKKTLKIVKV